MSCTCLLAPNCFHLLACATSLELLSTETDAQADNPPEEIATTVEVDGMTTDAKASPSSAQRAAAEEMEHSLGQLMSIGVANAGVVVQSGLLRAIHHCRAVGLHRAAAIGLRVASGVSQFRTRSPESNPTSLAHDCAMLLQTAYRIQHHEMVDPSWFGIARRKFTPVSPKRLRGLLAEPISTRSGYTGAAVYFLGDDDQIYSASDVKPGEDQNVQDAYLGGIEIGGLIQPAKQLARGTYIGSGLTASHDGRLGRGKSIRIVQQGDSSWDDEKTGPRFEVSLERQLDAVYANAGLPEDARRAGWDFLFLSGKVVGAAGPDLIFSNDHDDAPIRLSITNENESLLFRENLRMLCHAPGLRLRVIGRADMASATRVLPLAIGSEQNSAAATTRLELPEAWRGRACIGFDELQRQHVPGIAVEPSHVDTAGNTYAVAATKPGPLAALERRWVALLLSGFGSQRSSDQTSIQREVADLQRSAFPTAASLLLGLSTCKSSTFLLDYVAASIYLRRCQFELSRQAELSFSRAP